MIWLGFAPLAATLRRRRRPGSCRRALTLMELVLSASVTSMLLLGMMSAMLVASHALPDSGSAADHIQNVRDASEALNQVAADLRFSTAITPVFGALAITVPDRNHGAAGPETIAYAWSGKAGDPLLRSYNGGSTYELLEDLRAALFTIETGIGELHAPPRVLLISKNDGTSGSEDKLRTDLLSSWGYTVTVVGDTITADEIAPLLAVHDVVYISGPTDGNELFDVLDNWAVGVVIERAEYITTMQLSDSWLTLWDDSIAISDNTHEVASPFSVGSLVFASSAQVVNYMLSQTAGATVLARGDGVMNTNAVLCVVDLGGELLDKTAARGRRVVLPWASGQSALYKFDFSKISKPGELLLHRCLAWAAAPPVQKRATLGLLAGSDAWLETTIELVNQPRVPTP